MVFRLFTLIAVLALAVISWILSNPARTPITPSGATHAGSPGYFLEHAVMTDYDELGNPSIRIAAQRIDQIEHSTEVALYNVRVDYQSPDGQAWVMFGDEARVRSGAKIVDMTGNVRLQGLDQGQGPAVIQSDTMSYDVPEGVASTESDVRISFGNHALNARGLVANLKERTVRLESRVNGHFQP
jgi:LPS export ABC transporter protein LptC